MCAWNRSIQMQMASRPDTVKRWGKIKQLPTHKRLTALLYLKLGLCLIGLTAVLWANPVSGFAAQVTLRWDANEPIPDGYRLYQRTENGSYTQPSWSGTTTSCLVTNLADATRYFFIVRAYHGGSESSNSNEVTYTTPGANSEPVANAGGTQTPTTNPPLVNDTVSNQPPAQPQIIHPAHGADAVPLRPVFQATTFYDPNPGDRHAETEWLVLSRKDRSVVLNVTRTRSNLARLWMPRLILKPDTDYISKVRYYDERGNASLWSPENFFTTRQARYFLSDNNAAEIQNAPADTDLNANNVADIDEYDTLKSLQSPDGQRVIAVGIEAGENIVSLDAAIISDPLMEGIAGGLHLLPYGLLSYRIQVREPGQEAAVTIYFSEPVDPEMPWTAYGGEEQGADCSDRIYPHADGFAVVRLITDGGPDDADGAINGIIVDTIAPTAESNEYKASSTGCFIKSLLNN